MSELIGNNIIKLESVDSTNNYATKLIFEGFGSEGTVIFAEEQLNGKGQKGNYWESEGNKNLQFSIILYPEFLNVQDQFLLSKVFALSIYEVISLYVDTVSIKWPNDIYVGSNKVSGILIENSISGINLNYSIIGVGINVNQKIFTSGAPNPISLSTILNIEINCEELLILILKAADKWYKILKEGNYELINEEYESKMFQIGEINEFIDKNGSFKGVIKGVDEIGRLKIEKDNGQLFLYSFKEVGFKK